MTAKSPAHSTQKSGAVQALRALAIVFVILFHLDNRFAKNGFLGVDIFFVISGYLMTMILSKSGITLKSTGTFWQRRIKRILPLYYLTIASVMVVSRLILVAKDLRILRNDVIWSTGLLSNMEPLFHEYDYFEELTEYKLLVHTWSLAVELQYYLVVPLLMMLILSIGVYKRLLLATVIIIGSIGLQIFLPQAIGFGLLPCRVWQFFFGLLVFETTQKRDPRKETNRESGKEYTILVEAEESGNEAENADCLEVKAAKCSESPRSGSFLCMIAYAGAMALCLFSTGYPVIDRLLATFMAALVIYFSTKGPTPLLDVWCLQYIGDISYILYLAHWPVIILLKYATFEETASPKTMILAVLITVTIAVIVHHTLEKSFIEGSFLYALAWIGGLLGICVIFFLLPIRETNEAIGYQNLSGNSTKDCIELTTNLKFPKLENFKVTLGGYEKYGEDTGNGSFNVLLLGNSFMRFGFPHFHKALEKRYDKLYFHAITSCMPFEKNGLVDPKANWAGNCNRSMADDLKLLEKSKPKMIFMSVGYLGGFVSHAVEKEDRWVKTALESFEQFSKFADFIVLDTPFYKIDSKLADNLQKRQTKGIKQVPKEESQFTFQSYLKIYKNAFKRLEMIRAKCPKCHIIEVQSEFCDAHELCNSYDYDCGRTLYTTDGIHMTDFAKNLLFHRLKAEIDIIYTIASAKK